MKNKGWWIFLGVLMVFGMTASIYFGLGPRPVPKIKLSKFERPEVMSHALALRLRQELTSANFLILGLDQHDNDQTRIWQELLKHLQQEGIGYSVVLADVALNGGVDFPGAVPLDFLNNFQPIVDVIKQNLNEGKRVVAIVPSIYSAQFIHGNWAWRLREEVKLNPMSMTLQWFPRSREQEKDMRIPCVVQGVDLQGTGPFGCLVVQKARTVYLKKMDGPYVGLADLIGLNDYLVLFR